MIATLRALAFGLLITGVLACWVLVMFFPTFPATTAGWMAVLLVGVPLLFSLELIGNWVMSPRFLKHWPAPARIAYGVAALLLLVAVMWPVLRFAQQLIEA